MFFVGRVQARGAAPAGPHRDLLRGRRPRRRRAPRRGHRGPREEKKRLTDLRLQ